MTKPKSRFVEAPRGLDQKRVKEIKKYTEDASGDTIIVDGKKYSSKYLDDRHRKGVKIIVDGVFHKIPVYILPRKLLQLNPGNGRFDDNVDRLVQDRQKAGKRNAITFLMDDQRLPKKNSPVLYSTDLEMDLGGDVYQIRQMIKGLHPPDKEKESKYKELVGLMRAATKDSDTSSGQEDPCIATADGVYVNGNRRDCVLEDFFQQHGAKKKAPANTSVFTKVSVAICPPDVTAIDVKRMELHEQESVDPRAKFSAVATAKSSMKIYASRCKELGVDEKEGGKWNLSVVSEIADYQKGKDKADVIASLNLYDLAIVVLKKLGKPKTEMWRISVADPGTSIPCGEQLEESSKRYYNAENAREKTLHLNTTTAVVQCLWAGATLDDDQEQFLRQYGFQDVKRSAVKKVLGDKNGKFSKPAYWRGHNFKSIKSARQFDDDLNDEVETQHDQDELDKPKRLLDQIGRALKVIKEGVNNKTTGRKVARRLKDADASSRIDDFVTSLNGIKKKVKQITGTQKKSKQTRKKRKTVKRKSVKRKSGKRKPKRRAARRRR